MSGVRFGIWQRKDRCHYIAIDRGATFVDPIGGDLCRKREQNDARLLVDLANAALDHRHLPWWRRIRKDACAADHTEGNDER